MPVENAFVAQVQWLSHRSFAVRFQMHPGYFLYKEKLRLEDSISEAVHIVSIVYPPPASSGVPTDSQNRSPRPKPPEQKKPSPEVYRETVTLIINLIPRHSGQHRLWLNYQGCFAQQYCYPPEKLAIQLEVNEKRLLTAVRRVSALEQP
ncbi:MAG: protein-disulfide reductase DsbD N-terminal domain-containing protein [Legionellaceae bacterium]|nr:protein-disulfide reductase DsbD N-terminal domain-containing protein [Legionellaceae bacterium]